MLREWLGSTVAVDFQPTCICTVVGPLDREAFNLSINTQSFLFHCPRLVLVYIFLKPSCLLFLLLMRNHSFLMCNLSFPIYNLFLILLTFLSFGIFVLFIYLSLAMHPPLTTRFCAHSLKAPRALLSPPSTPSISS